MTAEPMTPYFIRNDTLTFTKNPLKQTLRFHFVHSSTLINASYPLKEHDYIHRKVFIYCESKLYSKPTEKNNSNNKCKGIHQKTQKHIEKSRRSGVMAGDQTQHYTALALNKALLGTLT